MGTRFLLTVESPVKDSVKQRYLNSSLLDTVVTRELDGVPQRVLAGGPVAELERSNAVTRSVRALSNAVAFQRASGQSWPSLMREAVALHREHELSWSQVIMTANAPMLYSAGLHEGREDIGVTASGQVVGLINDIPTCQQLIERIVEQALETLRRLDARDA
jgi:NAD(P)H-dependent flavin oxidoreductase YrpB (nitropropane dioxygenase family)